MCGLVAFPSSVVLFGSLRTDSRRTHCNDIHDYQPRGRDVTISSLFPVIVLQSLMFLGVYRSSSNWKYIGHL